MHAARAGDREVIAIGTSTPAAAASSGLSSVIVVPSVHPMITPGARWLGLSRSPSAAAR